MSNFSPQYEKPLAAPPFKSYRYCGPYGGIAIGAMDTEEALREARRSLCNGEPQRGLLEVWNGERWVPTE